jgi:hypothetical protein
MREYLRVHWHHNLAGEPVVLWSEVEDGWEVRKVEVFRDGLSHSAGPGGATGDTVLSESRMPRVAEIAEDPQFTVEYVSASDFEQAWKAAE